MTSDDKKNLENDRDLVILGTGCAFGFAILRWLVPGIDPNIESTGMAFIMTLGGSLAARRRRARRRAAQERQATPRGPSVG